MSYPNEPDFVVVKVGDGANPEVFTIICGIENAAINKTVNTTDRFRRDCEKPAAIPTRKVRVNSKQWDATGSGVINMDEFPRFDAALGIRKNYLFEFGKRNGTDAGVIIGTYAGPGVVTASNINMGDEGTAEITIAGEDDIVWTGSGS
jgi:hypothetical protein